MNVRWLKKKWDLVMTSKEHYGMYIGVGNRFGDRFLYVNAEPGTEVFDDLEDGKAWTAWQYDSFEEGPSFKRLEIVLPIEFLH